MAKQYPARLCEHCSESFVPNRSDKKYCTHNCQTYASSKRTGYKNKWTKESAAKRNKNHVYKKYKKDTCECCGFVAVHTCQLDVDHIDGVHSNNDKTNLQTLCANCHRLKTWLNRDWEVK